MLNNPPVSNPNDFKVVDFTNKTDFIFTPEMGCMYDSRPIFGITGALGIGPGESMKLPYHVGHRLAANLAKAFMLRNAPTTDPAGIPTGVPLWDTTKLETLKSSFITELYSENSPVTMSETDKLMAKVDEYKKMVDTLVQAKTEPQPVADTVDTSTATTSATAPVAPEPAKVYQDKQEVILELEKRGIKHDKRSSKAALEKLLA